MVRSSNIFIYLTAFLCFAITASAQDSLYYLSKDDVLSIVKQYHPVVQQASVKVDRYKAYITEARGGFDPKLNTTADQKTFDGQQYYSYFNPELKIPTWYGINIKAGAEEIYGNRALSELTLGKSVYAGVEMSVLRGLIFDERRATLRKAQAMRDATLAEQRLVVNDVLFEAAKNYWNWVRAYQAFKMYDDITAITRKRLQFVRLEYKQGNRPAIDTVEAWTQVQTYELSKNEALLDFYTSGYELSNYLWLDNNQPFDWSINIIPDSIALERLEPEVSGVETFIDQALSNHPKLEMVAAKINAIEIEKKLKTQAILPQLDVSANVLNKGYGLPNEITTPFLENNNKFSIDFSMPLAFRKERGAYRAAKLKLQEANLGQEYVTLELANKIRSYYNEVVILNNQIENYTAAYSNFQKMYRGELTRYNIGESTLFLVNSRENKMLQAKVKLLELKAKWRKSYAGLLWSAAYL